MDLSDSQMLQRMRESDFEFDWPFALSKMFGLKREAAEALEAALRVQAQHNTTMAGLQQLLNSAPRILMTTIRTALEAAADTGREIANATADEVYNDKREEFGRYLEGRCKRVDELLEKRISEAIDTVLGRLGTEISVTAAKSVEGAIADRKQALVATFNNAGIAVERKSNEAVTRLERAAAKVEQTATAASSAIEASARKAEEAAGRIWNNSVVMAVMVGGIAFVSAIGGVLVGAKFFH